MEEVIAGSPTALVFAKLRDSLLNFSGGTMFIFLWLIG
jgi:hypothetical protein